MTDCPELAVAPSVIYFEKKHAVRAKVLLPTRGDAADNKRCKHDDVRCRTLSHIPATTAPEVNLMRSTAPPMQAKML